MSDRRDFAIEPQLLLSFPPIAASDLHKFSPVLASTTYRCQCWVCMFPAAVIPVPDADCPDAVTDAVLTTTGTVSDGLSTKTKSAFDLSVTTSQRFQALICRYRSSPNRAVPLSFTKKTVFAARSEERRVGKDCRS